MFSLDVFSHAFRGYGTECGSNFSTKRGLSLYPYMVPTYLDVEATPHLRAMPYHAVPGPRKAGGSGVLRSRREIMLVLFV